MKYLKAAALILSLLFVVLALASCDGGDTDAETTTEEPADVTIKVSMKVKDIDGNVVYDIPEYTYNGKPPTPIDLIDFYFYLESDNETVVIDEYGDLVVIGGWAGTVSKRKESYILVVEPQRRKRPQTPRSTVKDGDK